ncbi:hypothetical protein PMAYCL1PPCAC_20936 [Pristionchus mayeri]|uniref:C-type lectin domain-containing protein n=1 Tax=Pristionchus mayeri TaxID=1317129 RepID=A0AAN5CU92_9BILA|nr:hypothetical protein PMAYCL1PPCAC_20936 [Pristionchus mayeri]
MLQLLNLLLLPSLTFSCTKEFPHLVYDGQCSYYSGSYSKTYDSAKSLCASIDSHFPMFYTEEDFDKFLTEYRNSFPWIGLRCDGVNFIWEDGTVATYTDFYYKETCDASKVDRRFYTDRNYDERWNAEDNHNISTKYYVCVADVRSCKLFFEVMFEK